MEKKLRIQINNSVYFLEDGESCYIYCEHKSLDRFIVKDNKKYAINTSAWFGDKEQNKYPIKFTYINDEIKIRLEEFAISYININNYTIPPGESSVYNIDDDSFLKIKITESSEQIYPALDVKFDYVNYDKENSGSGKDLLNPYKDNDNLNNKKFEDIDDITKIEYTLSRKLGANQIDAGVFRTVYDISDVDLSFHIESDGDIIKLAKDERSIDANKKETQTYQAVKGTEIEKFFCPITNIGPDHKYIVMKKAQISDNEINSVSENYTAIGEHKTYVGLIEDILNTAIIDPNGSVSDICEKNLGEYKGRNVIIDYQFGGNIYVDAGRLYDEPNIDEKRQEKIEYEMNNLRKL